MDKFSFEDLNAYKYGRALVRSVYALLEKFPAYERYALTDQLRRSVISIPSNIAEGMGRMAVKERIHFLEISYGSVVEVLCQLDLAKSLGYISEQELDNAEEIAARLTKVMSGLRRSLSEKVTQ